MEKSSSLLCRFAGFSGECVDNCPENEATSLENIGRSLLLTTIFAFVSSILFLKETDISDSMFLILPLSFLWAFSIFSIDRFSVSILNHSDSFLKNFIKVLPRLFLSLSIAVLIAAPVHVGIFSNDIKEIIDSQKRSNIDKYIEKVKKEEKSIQETYEKVVSNLFIEKINRGENKTYQDFVDRRKQLNISLAKQTKKYSFNCTNMENATKERYSTCEDISIEKMNENRKLESVEKKIDNILKEANQRDKSNLEDAEKLKQSSFNEIKERKKKDLDALKNEAFSIFEKEEFLFKETEKNNLLFIGFYSIILIFWIIDFYPVIAKLSNPTLSYDTCIEEKKKSYYFKRQLSNRIDKYISFRGYTNEKNQIQDRDVWDYSTEIENKIYREVYEHYGEKVSELAKGKISNWSEKFEKESFERNALLEKLFYDYFTKAVYGKNYDRSNNGFFSGIQNGFISLPMLTNVFISFMIVLIGIFVVNGGVKTIKSAIEAVIALGLLIEFFKLIIFRLIKKYI